MQNRLSLALKIAISAIGLYVVIRAISLNSVIDTMRNANLVWLAIAVFLMTASLFLRTVRWQVLLEGLGVKITFWRLATIYFVGNFFNAFLPSGFGGDVVRTIEASRDVPVENAAGTVIVDRMTGLLMQFVLVLIALPFRPSSFPQDWFVIITTIAIVGLLGGLLVLQGGLIRAFTQLLIRGSDNFVTRLIRKRVVPLLDTLHSCGWRAVGRALAISGIFNIVLITWWYISGLALGLSIDFPYYMLAVPILSLALLVPSISGLGVRELLAPILFGSAGVTSEEAVALSLTVLILMRITSLLGAPVYLWQSYQRAQTEA